MRAMNPERPKSVIPGEHRGSDAREGDPGIFAAPVPSSWIPFPRARKLARAGNDKRDSSASFGSPGMTMGRCS